MSIISPLFSSSSGNVTYIGTKNGAMLIDAGASAKKIFEAIKAVGGSVEEICAIAVTHEHIDHICGLKAVLNKTSAKLIGSAETLETLARLDKIPPKTQLVPLEKDCLDMNGIGIMRFATSHDCLGSSGYRVTLPDGKVFSLCTDLGVVTDGVREAITGSDLVLIESNHDIEMLKKGPYPPHLKVRILSNEGHLSNALCAEEIKWLFTHGTQRFILGHLSQHNNTPLVARSSTEAALMDLGAVAGKDYLLTVAKPFGNGVTVI